MFKISQKQIIQGILKEASSRKPDYSSDYMQVWYFKEDIRFYRQFVNGQKRKIVAVERIQKKEGNKWKTIWEGKG